MTDTKRAETKPAAGGLPATPAERALAEAAARRALRRDTAAPKELHGREGPDPVRYGDWEVDGRATDV